MFFQKKSRRVANIVVEDHVIRIVVANGPCLDVIELQEERALPTGLIEEGQIADELEFYEFMKVLVDELGLKKMDVRFYAPSSLIIMRQVEIPNEVKANEIQSYFEMEVGVNLHLPFEEPLIDVYPIESIGLEKTELDSLVDVASTVEEASLRKGLLFAASGDEIMKYTRVFEDLHLHPIAVDIQALGVYRYFYYLEKPKVDRVQLFLELNMCSVNISIFYGHHMEFLRFQQLELSVDDWVAENDQNGYLNWNAAIEKEVAVQETIDFQIDEIGRIMNFYRYSQNNGERGVDEIILHGDYPDIHQIAETLELTYNLKVQVFTGLTPDEEASGNPTAFVPAFGLALKGCV